MGAQLRVYRQKIRSAQTTKKITRAMELIAASRIQKALARVQASAPYARAVTRAVSAVATYSNVSHILTTEPEKIERAAILIFASDRGLAGAFNANVLKRTGERPTRRATRAKGAVINAAARRAVGNFKSRSGRTERAGTAETDNRSSATARETA